MNMALGIPWPMLCGAIAGFSGYVVGWYRPLHGKWLGYAVEHDRDHHVHVEPEKRLCAGLAGQWLPIETGC
jgi:hypothetical protein